MREHMTYKQAVGEEAWRSPAFVAGVDFEPGDEDDVTAVRFAGEIHRADYVRGLEEENARLRSYLFGDNEGARSAESE